MWLATGREGSSQAMRQLRVGCWPGTNAGQAPSASAEAPDEAATPARTSEDFEVVTADLAPYQRLLFDPPLKLPNVSDVRSTSPFGSRAAARSRSYIFCKR